MNPQQKPPPFPHDFFRAGALPKRPLLKLPHVRLMNIKSILAPQRSDLGERDVPSKKSQHMLAVKSLGRSQSTKHIPPQNVVLKPIGEEDSQGGSPKNESLPLLKPRLHFPVGKRLRTHIRVDSFFRERKPESQSLTVTFGVNQATKLFKCASQGQLRSNPQ